MMRGTFACQILGLSGRVLLAHEFFSLRPASLNVASLATLLRDSPLAILQKIRLFREPSAVGFTHILSSYKWRTRRGRHARKPCDDFGRAWLGQGGHGDIS